MFANNSLRFLKLFGFCCGHLLLAGCVILATQAVCLGAPNNKDTRVIGKFSLPESFKISEIKIKTSQLILLEEFAPKPLPTPKEFADWTQAKKNEWYEKWLATDAGKKFQASEDARFEKLKKHETKVQKGFEFRFGNVKAGNYDLAGELVIEHDSKSYFAEFFAKVVVSDVEEINLDRIDLKFFRILKVGDSLPEFEFKSVKNKKVNRKKVAGKHVLVVFWSPLNPFSQTIKKELLALAKEKKLTIVAIGLGNDEKHTEFLKSGRFASHHGLAKNMESRVCQAFGVSSFPFVWLANPSGKLVVSHQEFARSQFKIKQTVLNELRKNLF